MKIISFEDNSPCDGHLLIPCRIYCVELEIALNDLGLNAIEKCALKLKELEVKDEELKGFLGLGELDLLKPILEKIETKTLPEYKKNSCAFLLQSNQSRIFAFCGFGACQDYRWERVKK